MLENLLLEAPLFRILSISDFTIASSFFIIATLLTIFLNNHPILMLKNIMFSFILFVYLIAIFHAISATPVFMFSYEIQAIVKVLASLVSVLSCILLIQLLPKLDQYYDLVEELKNEKMKHSRTIVSLEYLNLEINNLVLARTKDLNLLCLPFSSACGIAISDKFGNIIRVNRSFERITGYRQDDVIGHNTRILKSGKHPEEFYKAMWKEIQENGIYKGKIYNKRKDGTIYQEFLTISEITNEIGEITNYVGIFINLFDS